MQPEVVREAQEWLVRAERDVVATEALLATSPPLPDMAVYHAQQAAEKALKAFLAARDQPFEKTHELVPLLDACRKLEPAFAQLLPAAQTLSPYATRFRYPPGPLAPSTTDAETALQLAREVVEFVRQRLGF